jgi:hypothetical protein
VKFLVVTALFALVFAGIGVPSDVHTGEEQSMQSTAREVLEMPFHFLLRIRGYDVVDLKHDGDIFSTWGQLVLARRDASHPNRAELRGKLSKAARSAGWRPTMELNNLEAVDLPRYGIDLRKSDLALEKTSALPGQNPPTRYTCLIWISDDGKRLVATYRVDGE